MEASTPGRRGSLAALGLLLIGVCIAYRHALDAPLVSDDWVFVERLRRGYFVHWPGEAAGFLRPLTLATFYLDVAIWRASPVVMHVENVLILGLTAALIVLLARDLWRDGSARIGAAPLALGAGVLFVVHPSHSEAVAWVSGRGDLLAAFFTVAYLLFGLAFLRAEVPRRRHLGLVGLALVAALLSKEVALAAPAMLLALYAGTTAPVLIRKAPRRIAIVTGLSVVVVGIYLLARFATFGNFLESGLSRAPVAPTLLAQLHRLVLPAVAEPQRMFVERCLHWVVWILVAACLGAALWRWRAGRRSQVVSFWTRSMALAAATLLALVPVTGLTVHPHDGQGERFLYLATVPLSIGIAGVIGHLFGNGRAAIAVVGLVAAAGFWGLQAPVRRWEVAGAKAREIVQVARRESMGRDIAILNLPDNYEGAYIFRNGLREALNWKRRRGERFQVSVLSGCDIDRRPVEVELRPEGPESVRFVLRSPARPLRIDGGSPAVPSFDGGSFLVSRSDVSRWSDVYVFEGGALRRVPAL